MARRYVLISYYRFDWPHPWFCIWRWRRKGQVPAMLGETTLSELTRANRLDVLSTYRLLCYGHMQTFTMLGQRPMR